MPMFQQPEELEDVVCVCLKAYSVLLTGDINAKWENSGKRTNARVYGPNIDHLSGLLVQCTYFFNILIFV